MLPQLKRIRWGVRAVLVLGVAASVIANVLHARNNPISQVIAAWPPLALLLTVELISRVPVHRAWLAALRLAATVAIAGIAAWVSYWHMVGVVARYGETGGTPYLMPFSVDGLVVIASICLVELAGRIRALEQSTTVVVVPEPVAASVDEPASVPAADVDQEQTETTPQSEPVTSAKSARRRPARRPSAADRVAKAAARTPAATPAQLAARLKLSERTVQRYMPRPADDTTPPPQRPSEHVNGRTPALVTADPGGTQ